MIPFWWACCTAWQTARKSSSRWRGGSALLVAVLGDRHALDQLHDEVGPAALRRPGVEDLGDVRVVHHGQGLALGLEAGDHPPAVHPRLDDLQGHLAAHGVRLLGQPDDAHAPLADLPHQHVRADGRARPLGARQVEGGGRPLGQVEQVAAACIGAQERLDLGA